MKNMLNFKNFSSEELAKILEIALDMKKSPEKYADSLKGKISNESPVGKALIGKAAGDEVTVETPNGQFKYKVLEIIKQTKDGK